MPAWPCGIDQQRSEPLYPPDDRDVIDHYAALSEQLFDVSVRQPVAQVPAHRHCDHLWRDAEPPLAELAALATPSGRYGPAHIAYVKSLVSKYSSSLASISTGTSWPSTRAMAATVSRSWTLLLGSFRRPVTVISTPWRSWSSEKSRP